MFYGVINRSQVIQPESGCAVYQFTAGSGNGIDCIPNGTANAIGDYMSSWTVISEDLMWRFPNNPQCGGLKLLQVGDASLARSKIGINANVGYMAAPSGSTTTCTALTLPGLNDNGLTEVRTCCITGFPAGLWHNEHTVLDNVYINYCAVGIRAGGGAHASNWSNVYLYQCGTAIKPSGSIVLQGGTIAFEQGPLFPGYRMEIDDWNGYLVGFLSYEGPQINVNGAWRLDLRSAGMPTQRSSLTPSLTASAMFSSGSAFPPVGGLPQLSTGQTWNCVGSDWCAGGGAAFAPGGGYATTQITNGVNPIVTMDVTTGATSAIGAILLGERDAQPHFSAVMVGGTTAQIREGSTVMASATFTYSPNAAYTIVADYGVTTPGAITMKVGGSVVVAYSLSDAQRVGYVGRTWVGMRIIAGSDNGSKVTRFAAS
jgi:hypothetical protein